MTNEQLDILGWLLLLAVDRGYSLATGQAPLSIADPGIERMLGAAEQAWRARTERRPTTAEPRPAWLEQEIARHAQQGAE